MTELQLRRAERSRVKLKISIAGPSGSGKSKSSLLLAYGITGDWNKIAIVDSENMSADMYAKLGDYNVITIGAPFTTKKYNDAIKICEDAGMEVIIVDSCTQVWSGRGGILEYQSSLGGRYQDWAKATPLYQEWLQTILQSKCHVICTLRKKESYSMEMENGKTKIVKQGLDDEIRGGFSYEMGISFDVDINHFAQATKDRTMLFDGLPPFKITPDTGKALLEWAESGKDVVFTPSPDTVKEDSKRDLKIALALIGGMDDESATDILNKKIGTKFPSINDLTEGQAKSALKKLRNN